MKNKGQVKVSLGMGVFLIVLVVILIAFAFVDPLKEILDDSRGDPALNCPGTPDFNQTLYDNQTRDEKLNQRSACAATGFYMVYFVGSIIIFIVIWGYRKLIK